MQTSPHTRLFTSWSKLSLVFLRCQRKARKHQKLKTRQENILEIEMLHSSKCMYIQLCSAQCTNMNKGCISGTTILQNVCTKKLLSYDVQLTTSSRGQDGGAYCGAAFGGKCMVSKAKWSYMNLLCSGMVGFSLQLNLGTAEKEHPSPLFPLRWSESDE